MRDWTWPDFWWGDTVLDDAGDAVETRFENKVFDGVWWTRIIKNNVVVHESPTSSSVGPYNIVVDE